MGVQDGPIVTRTPSRNNRDAAAGSAHTHEERKQYYDGQKAGRRACDETAYALRIADLMEMYWKMPRPSVLISISRPLIRSSWSP